VERSASSLPCSSRPPHGSGLSEASHRHPTTTSRGPVARRRAPQRAQTPSPAQPSRARSGAKPICWVVTDVARAGTRRLSCFLAPWPAKLVGLCCVCSPHIKVGTCTPQRTHYRRRRAPTLAAAAGASSPVVRLPACGRRGRRPNSATRRRPGSVSLQFFRAYSRPSSGASLQLTWQVSRQGPSEMGTVQAMRYEQMPTARTPMQVPINLACLFPGGAVRSAVRTGKRVRMLRSSSVQLRPIGRVQGGILTTSQGPTTSHHWTACL